METQGRCYFLIRPRRFGKSLLVSTLTMYFEWRRDLLEGLAIAQLEPEWTQHPVLHVDFNRDNCAARDVLEKTLNTILRNWERVYEREADDGTFAARFIRVIENAHAQTGRQVAVLVVEYDKTLLDTIPDDALQARNQYTLRGFYGAIKASAPHLRFAFLTGAPRFAHENIFSGLNNLRDISMSTAYAALRGITEAELYANFAEGVARMAARRSSRWRAATRS